MKRSGRTIPGLREQRLAKGLTQAALAKWVGCSTPTIGNIERGIYLASTDLAGRIERVISGKKITHIPLVPFKDEEEKAAMHRIWCERLG